MLQFQNNCIHKAKLKLNLNFLLTGLWYSTKSLWAKSLS